MMWEVMNSYVYLNKFVVEVIIGVDLCVVFECCVSYFFF